MEIWGIKIYFFCHYSGIQKDVLVLLCGDIGCKVGEILIMRVLNTVEILHLKVMDHFMIYIGFILVTNTNVVRVL